MYRGGLTMCMHHRPAQRQYLRGSHAVVCRDCSKVAMLDVNGYCRECVMHGVPLRHGGYSAGTDEGAACYRVDYYQGLYKHRPIHCTGVMVWANPDPDSPGCSCHLCAPCSHCMGLVPTCTHCGATVTD